MHELPPEFYKLPDCQQRVFLFKLHTKPCVIGRDFVSNFFSEMTYEIQAINEKLYMHTGARLETGYRMYKVVRTMYLSEKNGNLELALAMRRSV